MTIKFHAATELARIAYNAYGENRNWKTFDDRPMPTWEKLTEPIQIAWVAAAIAVRNAVKPDNPYRGNYKTHG